jgi:predicted small lipoprotein YifL
MPALCTRLAGALTLLLGGVLLSGCGQKGPLYLPTGQPTAPVVTPETLQTDPVQEEIIRPR